MDTFTDPKTMLAFPSNVGALIRQGVTTHPVSSAGYSVTYQIRGWLGGIKLMVAVDVYDKGLAEIPDGPSSPFVAIELQNGFHIMGGDAPLIHEDETDAFFDGTASPIGQLDPTGRFRCVNQDMVLNGMSVNYAVFLTGYRGHYIKVQVIDPSKGNKAAHLSTFFLHFLIGQLGRIP